MASTEHWIKVLKFGHQELVALSHNKEATMKLLRGKTAIYDIYFTHAAFSLREEMKIQARLRWQCDKKWVKISWTVKGPPETTPHGDFRKPFTKEFTEAEWPALLTVLDSLGFRPHTRRMKIRQSLQVTVQKGTAEVQIDQYPGIPQYAEITGPPKVCVKIADMMGVPQERQTRMTAGEVFSHYGIKDSTNILFPEGSEEQKLFAALVL